MMLSSASGHYMETPSFLVYSFSPPSSIMQMQTTLLGYILTCILGDGGRIHKQVNAQHMSLHTLS